jgi:hypothetical protein
VVEVDPVGKSRLKILDSGTGDETLALPNEEDLFITYPKWDPDGSGIISSARTREGTMLIIRQALATGIMTKLSDEYHQILGEVLPTSEQILFTSGFSGTNNIHSLSRSDGKLTQLTGSRFGAYHPALSPDHKRLVFADFDLDGYGLATLPMDSTLGIKTIPVQQDQMKQYDFKYFKTDGGPIFDRVADQNFTITPYRPWKHLLKVHSWLLTPGFYSAGLKLTSDNILENLHLEGGASYYYYERAPGFEASMQYGGFYPVLTAGISRFTDIPT